jgi:hypothetical protein
VKRITKLCQDEQNFEEAGGELLPAAAQTHSNASTA